MDLFQKFLTVDGGFSPKFYKSVLDLMGVKQNTLIKSLFLRILNITNKSVIQSMEKEGLSKILFEWYEHSEIEREIYFLQLLLEVFIVIPSSRKLIDKIKLLTKFDNPEITKLATALVIKWNKEKVKDDNAKEFIFIDLDKKKCSSVKRRVTVMRTAGLEETYSDADIYDVVKK